MTIEIENKGNGLYCVRVDNRIINNRATVKAARDIVNEIIKAENAKQNENNVFSNIEVVFC